MKVICVRKTLKDLNLKERGNLFPSWYDYGVAIGREYLVMGIVLYKDFNYPHYLIDNDGNPFWYPHMLFDVTNNKLPANWYIDALGDTREGNIRTLIGFKELCTDENYHDDLISEREEYALQIYFKRKQEIFDDYFG